MTTTDLTAPARSAHLRETVNVAIVGCGYWGPNLIRNFLATDYCTVRTVCDTSAAQLATIGKRFPGVGLTTDFNEVLADPSVDAVVIATPVETHANLAKRALSAGKHVLIEKPMTDSSADAEVLIGLAERRGLALMVDLTFVYTGAVRRIKQLIDTGELGKLYYYDSVRINLGMVQRDVSVIWDLAVHDLSIMNHLLPGPPRTISAMAAAHLPGGLDDIAYLTVAFDDNLLAHFHVNWLAPVKVRQILVGGDRRMIRYDDIEPTEKVKIYDRGISWNDGSAESRQQSLVAYRLGDMYAPVLDQSEALLTECAHFVDCVRHGTTPITDGLAGLAAVRQLEAAERSARNGGRPERL